MSVVSRTVLGLVAAAAMIFASVGTASAGCPYGGGAVVSIGIGGGRGYGGYGGYGGGYGVRSTSFYRAPVYQAPAVVYPARVHLAPPRRVYTHGHYGRAPNRVPGCFY